MPSLIEKIDALLPQTQCGQCSYTGCLPYAEAIATHGEAINRCPPGGVKTLIVLANLLDQDCAAQIPDMQALEKPPTVAHIRADECIGCTKCIQACPVDAIIGAAKQLHTVLINECTGCGLCVPPCPVDCIDMVSVTKPLYTPERARESFNARMLRLQRNTLEKNAIAVVDAKKSYIQAAVARAKAKKQK